MSNLTRSEKKLIDKVNGEICLNQPVSPLDVNSLILIIDSLDTNLSREEHKVRVLRETLEKKK